MTKTTNRKHLTAKEKTKLLTKETNQVGLRLLNSIQVENNGMFSTTPIHSQKCGQRILYEAVINILKESDLQKTSFIF